jgi:hypothetical protein
LTDLPIASGSWVQLWAEPFVPLADGIVSLGCVLSIGCSAEGFLDLKRRYSRVRQVEELARFGSRLIL